MSAPVVAEPDRMVDLIEFARVEVRSGDLEPWAEFIKGLRETYGHSDEVSLWLVRLYNAFDSMGSAFNMYLRWADPHIWNASSMKDEARNFPHMQERRNLHGGRGVKCFQSYCNLLGEKTQYEWLREAWGPMTPPEVNFDNLMTHTQKVWGVGRLAAFEWVEFLGKVMGWPVHAGQGYLWQSSGPRRSLQRLYGDTKPSPQALVEYADHCRETLRAAGVPLPWEDFETVICDFNVMREGRYYPGRHLAALRGEIEEVPEPWRTELLSVFKAVVPYPWNLIKPGIDPAMKPKYKETGVIHLPEFV